MYCICCKNNNVTPYNPVNNKNNQSEEDLIWRKETGKEGNTINVNNGMVNNGIIQIIDAGYGSIHDGDQFVIAICDDCIKKNLEDATLLYYDNYMYGNHYPPHVGFIEEEREKSKQLYRRRKNLDNLTE
jgi:hypothetical protein